MKKIEFSFVCDENPMKMEETSSLHGNKPITTRHCTKCERHIVDFTKFTPQQIADYLKAAVKPCGFMLPWQIDDVNQHLIQQEPTKTSPLITLAKVAAVVSSPLLVKPAFSQTTVHKTEESFISPKEGKIVTILVVKDKNDVPMDSVSIELYIDNVLIQTLVTDASGKVTLEHNQFANAQSLVIKNSILGIEKNIALKQESTCMVWHTGVEKTANAILEEPVKFDFQFVYRDKNQKPIRFSKVEMELYDTTNTIIETIDSKTNISGYSYLKTSKFSQVKYVSLIVYTNKGRRSAYVNVNELVKGEINLVRFNKKFRRHLMGAMSF